MIFYGIILAIVAVMFLTTVSLRGSKPRRPGIRSQEVVAAEPARPTRRDGFAVRVSARRLSDGLERDSLPPDAVLTPREQREHQHAERRQTGLCLFCAEPATRVTPRLILSRSASDWLHRKLSSLSPARVRIREAFDTDELPDVCASCAEVARVHLDVWLAEDQASIAEFLQRRQRALLEFQRHGLYERMGAAEEEMRVGVPRQKIAALRAAGG